MFKSIIVTRTIFYSLFFSLIACSVHYVTGNELSAPEQLILQNVVKNPWALKSFSDISKLSPIADMAHQNPYFKEQLLATITTIKKNVTEEQHKDKYLYCAPFILSLGIIGMGIVTIQLASNLDNHEQNEPSYNPLFTITASTLTQTAWGAFACCGWYGKHFLKKEERLCNYLTNLTILESKLTDADLDLVVPDE